LKTCVLFCFVGRQPLDIENHWFTWRVKAANGITHPWWQASTSNCPRGCPTMVGRLWGRFHQCFTCGFCVHRSQKRKKYSQAVSLSGSAHIKAAHKMLMKLTPGCITVWQDLSAEVTGKSGHCCCCCWLLRKELFVMFPFLYKLWTQTWLCEFEIGVPDGCWAENCSTK